MAANSSTDPISSPNPLSVLIARNEFVDPVRSFAFCPTPKSEASLKFYILYFHITDIMNLAFLGTSSFYAMMKKCLIETHRFLVLSQILTHCTTYGVGAG